MRLSFGLVLVLVSQLITGEVRAAAPAILSFKAIQPRFVVSGRNLSSVEIWFEPTGTGLEPGRLGMARRTSRAGKRETWVMEIPPGLMAVKIFAIAYDKAHREVGRQSLPQIGVSLLNEALYGPAKE